MATLDQDDLDAIRAVIDAALLVEHSRVYDSFTDTNATLLSAHSPEVDASRNGWTKEDGQNITIQSNAAVVAANDFGTLGTVYVIDTTEKSFRARVGFICPYIESQNFYFRYDKANGSCYYLQTFPQGNSSRLRLRYFNGAAETTITEKTINYAEDVEQFLQIIVDGAELRAFIEGVDGSVITYQMDANLSATYFGIGGLNVSTQVTSLSIKPSTSASSASDLSNSMAELTASVELLVTTPAEAIASNLPAISDAVSLQLREDVGIGTDTARSVVVTVSSSAGNVTGARVSVLTSASVATGQVATTNSSGQVTLTLDDGSYKLRVLAPRGYDAISDQSITVSSGSTTATVTLTASSAAEPSSPTLCTVQTYILDAGGEPIENATLEAIASNRASTQNNILIADVKTRATTDSDGYAELTLPRAAAMTNDGIKTFVVTVKKDGKNIRDAQVISVPDQATAWLEDLVNA